jgi:hypothetical protein
VTAAEIDSLRPKKTYKVIGLIGILVLAAGAAFLLVQSRSADANGTAKAIPSPGAAVQGAKSGSVIDLDALPPAVLPGGTASAAVQASANALGHGPHAVPTQASQRRVVLPPVIAKPGTPLHRRDDEPDVGY